MERHLEYLNVNSLRNFPFIEDIELPFENNLIVDAALSIPDNISGPFFVKKIFVTPGLVSVSIANSTETIGVASGQIISNQKYFPIYLDSVNETISGSITISEGIFDINQVQQSFEYTLSQTTLEPSVISRTSDLFVREILVDGNDFSFRKDVIFREGEGVKIDIEEESNSVIFSARFPDAFVAECNRECFPGECNPQAIYQINNVQPDADGELFLEGDGTVSIDTSSGIIEPSTPQISINDLCENKNSPSAGRPGNPGQRGADGPDGILILPGEEIPASCTFLIEDGPDPLSEQNGGFVPNDPPPLEGSAEFPLVNAAEDITAGQALYISGENFVAKANSSDDIKMPCVGFAVDTVTSGNPLRLQVAGRISLGGGLVSGDTYYVSSVSDGSITNVPPSSPGNFVQKIGVAINDSILLIMLGKSKEVE